MELWHDKSQGRIDAPIYLLQTKSNLECIPQSHAIENHEALYIGYPATQVSTVLQWKHHQTQSNQQNQARSWCIETKLKLNVRTSQV